MSKREEIFQDQCRILLTHISYLIKKLGRPITSETTNARDCMHLSYLWIGEMIGSPPMNYRTDSSELYNKGIDCGMESGEVWQWLINGLFEDTQDVLQTMDNFRMNAPFECELTKYDRASLLMKDARLWFSQEISHFTKS